jgi:hypothetical protein
MIHVDVRRDAIGDYRVETSVDGAGWALQYLHCRTVGETEADVKSRAEHCARTFAAGCQFAGARVKMTSGGYGL